MPTWDKAPCWTFGDNIAMAPAEMGAVWLRAPEYEDPGTSNSPYAHEEEQNMYLDRIVGELDIRNGPDLGYTGDYRLPLWFVMLQADITTGNPELPWDPFDPLPQDDPDLMNPFPYFWHRKFYMVGAPNSTIWDYYDDPWWVHVDKKVGRGFGLSDNLWPAVVWYNPNPIDFVILQLHLMMYIKG